MPITTSGNDVVRDAQCSGSTTNNNDRRVITRRTTTAPTDTTAVGGGDIAVSEGQDFPRGDGNV